MKNKNRNIFIIVIFVIAFTKPIYSQISLSGDIIHESRVLIDKGLRENYHSGDFIKAFSRLQLEFDRNDEENFSLHGEIWTTENHLTSHNDDVDTEDGQIDSVVLLREAYVKGQLGNFEFNIGKMILNWGRADYINPVDVINPEDFSEFYTVEKMDIKMSILLFNGRYFCHNLTLETVWIPFFENSIIPTSGPWVPREICKIDQVMSTLPFDYDISFDSKLNEKHLNIDKSEIAFRISGVSSYVDFGLLYFSGYNDQGGLALELSGGDTNQVIFSPVYHRFNGYGLDFGFMLNGYGLRGEFFYRDEVPHPSLSEQGMLYNKITSDFQSIVGIDKFYGDNFYINCQYIYKVINNYSPEMVSEEDEYIITLLIENKFYYEQLKIASKIFYGIERSDAVLNPFCEYLVTDNLKTECGAYIFAGSRKAFFGQYDLNDHVYLRMNYSF